MLTLYLGKSRGVNNVYSCIHARAKSEIILENEGLRARLGNLGRARDALFCLVVSLIQGLAGDNLCWYLCGAASPETP